MSVNLCPLSNNWWKSESMSCLLSYNREQHSQVADAVDGTRW